MKENTLKVNITRTPEEIFEFTLDPANTPKWIDFIAEEQTSEWPAKLGTIYRNRAEGGPWSDYELTSYSKNHHFTLSRKDSPYLYPTRSLPAATISPSSNITNGLMKASSKAPFLRNISKSSSK